jgi:DNA-binding response OmpR family regulator
MEEDARTLLIVDSDRNSAITLELLFAQNGFQVIVARTAEEALERLETRHFALALIDARLPFRSGYELSQIISGRRLTEPTRVILLLGSGTAADEAKARAMGADAWFAKPYATKELVRAARALLEPRP